MMVWCGAPLRACSEISWLGRAVRKVTRKRKSFGESKFGPQFAFSCLSVSGCKAGHDGLYNCLIRAFTALLMFRSLKANVANLIKSTNSRNDASASRLIANDQRVVPRLNDLCRIQFLAAVILTPCQLFWYNLQNNQINRLTSMDW